MRAEANEETHRKYAVFQAGRTASRGSKLPNGWGLFSTCLGMSGSGAGTGMRNSMRSRQPLIQRAPPGVPVRVFRGGAGSTPPSSRGRRSGVGKRRGPELRPGFSGGPRPVMEMMGGAHALDLSSLPIRVSRINNDEPDPGWRSWPKATGDASSRQAPGVPDQCRHSATARRLAQVKCCETTCGIWGHLVRNPPPPPPCSSQVAFLPRILSRRDAATPGLEPHHCPRPHFVSAVVPVSLVKFRLPSPVEHGIIIDPLETIMVTISAPFDRNACSSEGTVNPGESMIFSDIQSVSCGSLTPRSPLDRLDCANPKSGSSPSDKPRYRSLTPCVDGVRG